MLNKNSKIYVAGHEGMVGSSIVRELNKKGFNNLVMFKHNQLDLINQADVEKMFQEQSPEYVFLAAAKVGGIYANNTYPADFIYENLMIEMNVIHSAFENKVKKLLYLGSSCIYPKFSLQPIKENSLLTSALEKTNEAYALAKIAGLKYCQYLNKQYGTNFISVMPCNLYGPNDNYNPDNSHVIPALIQKFHNAKLNDVNEVVCWGDGSPLREFLYVDDLAKLLLILMEKYDDFDPINAGSGYEISIKQLAEIIASIVGYNGNILWDISKPNGTPRKLLDISKIKDLGFSQFTNLKNGISITYKDYLNQHK